jgi:uncharacterized protein
MSLQEDRPEGILAVRAVTAGSVVVEARELTSSFLLAPDAVVEDWSPRRAEDIDAAALEAALALDPQLVLVGTGTRQHFLHPRLTATLLSRGIGVEVMDNAACARTFNLLALEGRRVVAAFVLGEG